MGLHNDIRVSNEIFVKQQNKSNSQNETEDHTTSFSLILKSNHISWIVLILPVKNKGQVNMTFFLLISHLGSKSKRIFKWSQLHNNQQGDQWMMLGYFVFKLYISVLVLPNMNHRSFLYVYGLNLPTEIPWCYCSKSFRIWWKFLTFHS